jgi:hypothetical protein
MRIVVDALDLAPLPVEQHKLLADKLALRDEARLLDERDDIGRSDRVVSE